MPTLYDPKTGQPVELYGEAAAKAVLSGQLALQKGAEVPVVNPDGQVGILPAELVHQALGEGYRFQTDEERATELGEARYGGAGGEAKAAALGVARGLTLGISDPAARVLGVPKQELAGLKEVNPGASIGGEVVGTLAGALIPGSGPAQAAKAGAAAERAVLMGGKLGAQSLARRAAAKAVGGAVEGGLYGLGGVISESAIDDVDLTAERLVAGVGMGGLVGAGGNVATGALKEGVSKLLGSTTRKLGAKSLQGALEELANDRAVKAVAGNGHLAAIRKLDKKGVLDTLGKDAIEQGVLSAGATADDMLARASAKAQEFGKEIGDVIAFGDAKARPLVNGAALADQVERDLVQPLLKGNVGDQAVAERIAREAAHLRSKGDMSFAEAEELKRSFDKYLKFGAEQSPVQEQLQKVRGIIGSDVERKLDAIGQSLEPGLGERFQRAKRLYGAMRELEDLAGERVLQLRNNRSISPSDYGFGGALGLLGGGPGGVAMGVAGAVGHKLLRERGPQVLAVALHGLAESKVLQRLGGAFSKRIGEQLRVSPGVFGEFRGLLANAAARGADDLVATHVSLFRSDPAYRDTMAAAGYAEESPDAAEVAATRAERFEAVHGALEEQGRKLDAAIGRFLGTQSGAAPKFSRAGSKLERIEAYEKRLARLERLADDPEVMMSALAPGELADLSPELGAASTAVATRAVEFLRAKAPRNPFPSPIPALEQRWQPSESELASWERYVTAVDRPEVLVAELRRGAVSTETVEAVQAVYPKLIEDIRQRMMERVGQHGAPLSARQRSALSTLFEASIGGAGDVDRIAIAQRTHAAAIRAEQQRQAAQAARVQSKSAEQLQTPTQRIEGR